MAKGIWIIPTRELPWGTATLKPGVEVEMTDPKAAKCLVDSGSATYAPEKKSQQTATTDKE